MAMISATNFTLHLPGRSEAIPLESESFPSLEDEIPERSPLQYEVEIEFDVYVPPEGRRILMVHWIIADALAAARRILD